MVVSRCWLLLNWDCWCELGNDVSGARFAPLAGCDGAVLCATVGWGVSRCREKVKVDGASETKLSLDLETK